MNLKEFRLTPSVLLKVVLYSHFNDWLRKTHKKIVPGQIDGIPSTNEDFVKGNTPKVIKEKAHIMLFSKLASCLGYLQRNISRTS